MQAIQKEIDFIDEQISAYQLEDKSTTTQLSIYSGRNR